MYQIFFVLCNDERNFQYCNTARCSYSYSYSLPPPHMPPKVAMWLLHFWPNPKRAQPDSASTYATLLAVASVDQATICTRIDFTRFICFSYHIYVFHSFAESPMAPSMWSGATSRGWSSTTSPTSTRASTNAARRATSMARSVSPYPIRSHCKLWVSAVYSYVLCTCCCGSAARQGRGGGSGGGGR